MTGAARAGGCRVVLYSKFFLIILLPTKNSGIFDFLEWNYFLKPWIMNMCLDISNDSKHVLMYMIVYVCRYHKTCRPETWCMCFCFEILQCSKEIDWWKGHFDLKNHGVSLPPKGLVLSSIEFTDIQVARTFTGKLSFTNFFLPQGRNRWGSRIESEAISAKFPWLFFGIKKTTQGSIRKHIL